MTTWTYEVKESPVGGSVCVRAWLFQGTSTHAEPRCRPTGSLKIDLAIYVNPPTRWELFWRRSLTFRKKVDAARIKVENAAISVCSERERRESLVRAVLGL